MNSVERVKRLCKQRKVPIARLERELNFSNGYIGQLRKGVLPYERAVAIAEYFGVTPEYLLTGEETKKESTSISESELQYSDIDLLEAFKRADPDIQELIRRTLKLK